MFFRIVLGTVIFVFVLVKLNNVMFISSKKARKGHCPAKKGKHDLKRCKNPKKVNDPTYPPTQSPIDSPTDLPSYSPTPCSVCVSTSKVNYNLGELILVNVVNSSPSLADWVGIYDCSTQNELGWKYTGGVSSRSFTIGEGFDNWPFLPACYYVSYYDGNDVKIADSQQFNIISTQHPPTTSPPTNLPTFVSGAGLSSEKYRYSEGEEIVINFINDKPKAMDWIGIFDCSGTYGEDELAGDFTFFASAGSGTFGTRYPNFPFPAGCYYALYYDKSQDSRVLLAEAQFYII